METGALNIEQKTKAIMTREMELLRNIQLNYSPDNTLGRECRNLLDKIINKIALESSTYQAPVHGEVVQDSATKLIESLYLEVKEKDKIIESLKNETIAMKKMFELMENKLNSATFA